jgi:hypothetical protein|tara:strand:- start:342 stop:695 length:354 start_codon:yes stop_codon:yes gene_type:complete
MPLTPPKKQKNKNWKQFTKDFVKEWPEVLEGLSFQTMPIQYIVQFCIVFKSKVVVSIDVAKDLKTKKPKHLAKSIKTYINNNYENIQNLDVKFDVKKLKEDMESKTNIILNKAFRKN